MSYDYIRDGAAIYVRSFATIRAETDLTGLTDAEARVAGRGGGSPTPPARPCVPGRRSCATRTWSPTASPAPASPPATR
jgi:hypothetical protein